MSKDADATQAMSKDAEPPSKGGPFQEPTSPDAAIDTGTSPASHDAGRPDAAPIAPTMPTTPTCVPATEVCDGKDNNCDGNVDESGGAWWPDCDDDGFAASAAKQVGTCTKPAATSACPSWTATAPHGQSNVDCDDASALRYPGASFGLSDGTNSDLNCDGTIQFRYDFVASDNNTFNSTTPLNVCTTNTQCGCLAPLASYTGYKDINSSTGRVDADTTNVLYDIEKAPPPCALASTDVISLVIVGPEADCRMHASSAGGISLVARKVCK